MPGSAAAPSRRAAGAAGLRDKFGYLPAPGHESAPDETPKPAWFPYDRPSPRYSQVPHTGSQLAFPTADAGTPRFPEFGTPFGSLPRPLSPIGGISHPTGLAPTDTNRHLVFWRSILEPVLAWDFGGASS